VEMLIGLVLLGIVTTTLYRILTTNQRLARAQTEQVSLQSAVRTGSLVVANELRELGINTAGASDILAMSATSITYRAMRSIGVACAVTTAQVDIRRNPYWSSRPISPGQDGLMIFVESDSTISSDDVWLILPLNSTPGSGTCPDGSPAIRVTTSSIATPLINFKMDAPVHIFEVMQLGILNVGGQNWLGAQSVSGGGPMQPALGPITANGLQFTYRDAGGAVTTNPAAVRSIEIMIRGETDRTVRAGGQGPLQLSQDSLSMLITLRNAPHP
jgi:hypothetical protein